VLATQYYANTHPSIGNYLMMTTGQIITNSDGYQSTITADNVVRHLLTAGKTWKAYADSLPSVGYTGGDVYPYCEHHNPLTYFSDVRNSSVQKLNLVPFTHFATDLANGTLPEYSFIVPNMLHDAHDGTLSAADNWLKTNIAPLLASATFQKDGLLLIVTDESFDTDTAHGGGHVELIAVGPMLKTGYKSTNLYQHQNLARMSLEALGVTTFPGSAASASGMTDFYAGSSSGGGGGGTCKASLATLPNVTICTPTSNSTDNSPVNVTAAAAASTAVTTMQIYLDGVKVFESSGSSLNTNLTPAAGTHRLTVQAYDSNNNVFKSTEYFTIP
jgi:acid phosphatase